MQGGKNWILPKEINANRFFWDSHWLEILSNHFCSSMGLKGGSVATDSEAAFLARRRHKIDTATLTKKLQRTSGRQYTDIALLAPPCRAAEEWVGLQY
jgi:hypothetical protein